MIHGDVNLENMILNMNGEVRLFDFAETRWDDEDDDIWEGETTMHCMSSNKWIEEARQGSNTPSIKEHDLYGLSLNVWGIYSGKLPFEDMADDDMQLRVRLFEEESVDVMLVDDEEARAIIMELLSKGGARNHLAINLLTSHTHRITC